MGQFADCADPAEIIEHLIYENEKRRCDFMVTTQLEKREVWWGSNHQENYDQNQITITKRETNLELVRI